MWIALLLGLSVTVNGDQMDKPEPQAKPAPGRIVVPPPSHDAEHPQPKWVHEIAILPEDRLAKRISELDLSELLEVSVFMRLDSHPPDMRAADLLARKFGREVFPAVERMLKHERSDRFAYGLVSVTSFVCERLNLRPSEQFDPVIKSRVRAIKSPNLQWSAEQELEKIQRYPRL